jgi:hypothetical protein
MSLHSSDLPDGVRGQEMTIADPDGYRVVLQNAAWPG